MTEVRAKIFKSGNSVALRLPKSLGLKAGDEMVLHETRGGFVAEAASEKPRLIDLTGIAGSIPGLKPIAAKDRLFEDRELDWDLKRTNGD